jgi:hypothetical protein
VWRSGPFSALTSPKKCHHSFLSSARLLHPRIHSTYDASLWTTSALRVLGFPTDIVLWNFPLSFFFEILSSPTLKVWPARPSLIISISSPNSDLSKDKISLFHVGHLWPCLYWYSHPLSAVCCRWAGSTQGCAKTRNVSTFWNCSVTLVARRVEMLGRVGRAGPGRRAPGQTGRVGGWDSRVRARVRSVACNQLLDWLYVQRFTLDLAEK